MSTSEFDLFDPKMVGEMSKTVGGITGKIVTFSEALSIVDIMDQTGYELDCDNNPIPGKNGIIIVPGDGTC